jgi:hypothetical protein
MFTEKWRILDISLVEERRQLYAITDDEVLSDDEIQYE